MGLVYDLTRGGYKIEETHHTTGSRMPKGGTLSSVHRRLPTQCRKLKLGTPGRDKWDQPALLRRLNFDGDLPVLIPCIILSERWPHVKEVGERH